MEAMNSKGVFIIYVRGGKNEGGLVTFPVSVSVSADFVGKKGPGVSVTLVS